MTDAVADLSQRVALFDAPPTAAEALGLHADTVRFVRTMQRVTRPGTALPPSRLPSATPSECDAIVRDSRLLRRLLDAFPQVTAGPLDRRSQRWIATGRPAHFPPRMPRPEAQWLIPPSRGPGAGTGPAGVGMFTSTAYPGSEGMWWDYLEVNRGSSLFPVPWAVWSVRPDDAARVLEIRGAADWAELALGHPIRRDGVVHVDWAAVAPRWDAIHATLFAVAAVQGIWLSVDDALVAPMFWDVESTLWLRWVFTATELIREVNP